MLVGFLTDEGIFIVRAATVTQVGTLCDVSELARGLVILLWISRLLFKYNGLHLRQLDQRFVLSSRHHTCPVGELLVLLSLVCGIQKNNLHVVQVFLLTVHFDIAAF